MSGQPTEATMKPALEAIVQMHRPVAGQGYSDTGYGTIDPACETCGQDDEYAVPWPCLTVKAAYIGLDLPYPDATPVEVD